MLRHELYIQAGFKPPSLSYFNIAYVTSGGTLSHHPWSS